MSNSTTSTIAAQQAAADEGDPTKISVALSKFFKNYKRVVLGLFIFAFSSWQLSILSKPKTFFPSYPSSPPYSSNKAKFKMSPLTAFSNIIMSVIGNGLVGMSRGVKCCPDENNPKRPKPMKGGGQVQRGGDRQTKGKQEDVGDIISNISFQWGDDDWKPFDIYSDNIGWPYDQMYINPSFTFSYWLGRSQMISWMIPRQIFQAILLILSNFSIAKPRKGSKKNNPDSSFLWFTRFLVTLILPFVFVFSLAASTFVAIFSTIWGGFFQHLIDWNFSGLLWGFFLTWLLVLYNMVVQPLELFASLFTIPFLYGGKNFVKENFGSWNKDKKSNKPAGYKELIYFMLAITLSAVAYNSFMPVIKGHVNIN